jgi:hypothetical protein
MIYRTKLNDRKELMDRWNNIPHILDSCTNYVTTKLKWAIINIFLPALYGESLKDCTYRHNIAALPVKFSDLALPDPSVNSESNYDVSTLVCSHLLAAFRGTDSFSSTNHKSEQTAVMAEYKSRRTEKLHSTLTNIHVELDCKTCRTTI